MLTLFCIGMIVLFVKVFGLITKIWLKVAAFGLGALLVLMGLMLLL